MPPSEAKTLFRKSEQLPSDVLPYVSEINGKYRIHSLGELEFDGLWTDSKRRGLFRGVVPIEKRGKNLPSNVTILSAKPSDDVGPLMKEVTDINRYFHPDNPEARLSYQTALSKVFREAGEKLKSEYDLENAIFAPAQRGADIVRAFFEEQGIIQHPENVMTYELKRSYIPGSDGFPVVGIIDAGGYPNRNFDTAVVIDDCLASDVSASASIDLIKTKYKNIKNENIVVVVSAATQIGIEQLSKSYPNIRIIAATLVYSMSEDYYLMRAKEERDTSGKSYKGKKGVQYVGDMGAWAEILPAEFNDKAPWNAFRKAKAA